jgi:hypothetical protein
MQHKSPAPCLVPEMLSGMQLIGTTPPKQLNNGLVLQLCVKEGCNCFKEACMQDRLVGTLDQERKHWVGEHQLAHLWLTGNIPRFPV